MTFVRGKNHQNNDNIRSNNNNEIVGTNDSANFMNKIVHEAASVLLETCNNTSSNNSTNAINKTLDEFGSSADNTIIGRQCPSPSTNHSLANDPSLASTLTSNGIDDPSGYEQMFSPPIQLHMDDNTLMSEHSNDPPEIRFSEK
jgi:hypothetical protein